MNNEPFKYRVLFGQATHQGKVVEIRDDLGTLWKVGMILDVPIGKLKVVEITPSETGFGYDVWCVNEQ